MEQVFTKENFEQQVLGAKQPVLVDFWAPWCGPCRMLGPVVQRVAGDAQGRWQVGKVNVDEQPELARRFGIMSIPTVMVFKNGALHAQAVGVQPQQKLEEMLQSALGRHGPAAGRQGGQNVLRPPGPAAGKGKTDEALPETACRWMLSGSLYSRGSCLWPRLLLCGGLCAGRLPHHIKPRGLGTVRRRDGLPFGVYPASAALDRAEKSRRR